MIDNLEGVWIMSSFNRNPVLIAFFISLGIFVISIIIPIIIGQVGDGWTALTVGLIMIPSSVGLMILAPLLTFVVIKSKERKMKEYSDLDPSELEKISYKKMRKPVRNALIVSITLFFICIACSLLIWFIALGARAFFYVIICLGILLLVLIPLITWYIHKDISQQEEVPQ